jgi:hypothetical protein
LQESPVAVISLAASSLLGVKPTIPHRSVVAGAVFVVAAVTDAPEAGWVTDVEASGGGVDPVPVGFGSSPHAAATTSASATSPRRTTIGRRPVSDFTSSSSLGAGDWPRSAL